MAEEFQAGICGGNWWNINSTRNIFPLSSSPCSMAANDAGSYSTWQTEFVDLKPAARSCATEETTNLVSSDTSVGFLDLQKPQQTESASGSGSILIDSTLQMMGFGLSSPSTSSSGWNHSLLSGRPERNFHSLLQEQTVMDSSSPQIRKDWSPANSFSSCGGAQVSTINNSLKPMNQDFPLDQQNLSSGSSTVNFPIGSASYGFPSSLIQSLYEPETHQQQPQHSFFTNRSMAYSSSTGNYVTNSSSNDLSTTWSNKLSPFLKPKQQLSGLHFSNNTPFWNASADALVDLRTGVFGSPQPQYDHQNPKFDEKHNCPNLITKAKSEEAVPDSASTVKKSSAACEPAFKRPRIETPSPLPTFKVRKEKLGDRITALQQLVSPFGKTDTASVLHEAIEYIKFLHDQVNVFSTPYLKNGAPIQHQQVNDTLKDSEGSKQDLRSRGLCLVPISSTVPVASETTADFWTPTFGGALIR